VDEGVLHRSTGLLIGPDASGFDLTPEGYRISNMVEGITARRVRELGGMGPRSWSTCARTARRRVAPIWRRRAQ
jgi:hypothetical protein